MTKYTFKTITRTIGAYSTYVIIPAHLEIKLNKEVMVTIEVENE